MWLQRQTRTKYSGVPYLAPTVDPLTRVIGDCEWSQKRVRKPSAADVAQLKDKIERLVANDRLRRGTKLASALEAFADTMDVKAKLRAKEEEEVKKGVDMSDAKSDEKSTPANRMSDAFKTFEYIVGAVAARPARRGLVHLDDVLRSVMASLDRLEGFKARNPGITTKTGLSSRRRSWKTITRRARSTVSLLTCIWSRTCPCSKRIVCSQVYTSESLLDRILVGMPLCVV